MPTFATVLECVNAPSAACLASQGSFIVAGLSFLAALFGWWQATQDAILFNHRFGRLLVAALGLVFASAVAAGVFFMFNPNAPLGVESDPMKQSIWVAVVCAFGLGLLLLGCAFGFGIGGSFARALGKRRTSACPASSSLSMARPHPAKARWRNALPTTTAFPALIRGFCIAPSHATCSHAAEN